MKVPLHFLRGDFYAKFGACHRMLVHLFDSISIHFMAEDCNEECDMGQGSSIYFFIRIQSYWWFSVIHQYLSKMPAFFYLYYVFGLEMTMHSIRKCRHVLQHCAFWRNYVSCCLHFLFVFSSTNSHHAAVLFYLCCLEQPTCKMQKIVILLLANTTSLPVFWN